MNDNQAIIAPFEALLGATTPLDQGAVKSGPKVAAKSMVVQETAAPGIELDGQWWQKYFADRSPNKRFVKHATGDPLKLYIESVGHEPPEVPAQWLRVIPSSSKKTRREELAREICG